MIFNYWKVFQIHNDRERDDGRFQVNAVIDRRFE